MLFHADSGNASRFAQGKDLDAYLQPSHAVEIETIGPLGAFEETVFLGLRLTDGLSFDALRKQFPRPWIESLRNTALDLARSGLMDVQDDRVRLTHSGRLVSSSIFGELLAAPAH
jgi:oxygen-independent coproporphyrinogen-3 oxidase